MKRRKQWLVLATLSCLMQWPMASRASWDDGLIAYYSFDDAQNLSRDSSGNGFDGQQYGPVQSMPKGAKGAAVFFDGSGARIEVAALSNQVWGSQLTVSLWFYRSGEYGWYSLLLGSGAVSDGAWEIRMGHQQEGKLLGCGVLTMLDTNYWDVSDGEATTRSWHHVVMTYDGLELIMYLDDVIHESTNDDQGFIRDLYKPLVMGGAAQVGSSGRAENFMGMLDEVLIYNRVLSRAEISALYSKEYSIEGASHLAETQASKAPTPAGENAAVSPADPLPAKNTPSREAIPVETHAKETHSVAAVGTSSPNREADPCCENLKKLLREWEKGNTQTVMSMLEKLRLDQ